MLQLPTIFFLIAFSLLAVIHHLAIRLFLYWQFIWFDMPMHFLGGAVVALGVYTLQDLRLISRAVISPVRLLLLVLLVALAWEVFELVAGVPIEATYYLDTAIDLVMGLAGGCLGYVVGKSLRSL